MLLRCSRNLTHTHTRTENFAIAHIHKTHTHTHQKLLALLVAEFKSLASGVNSFCAVLGVASFFACG